MSKPDVPPVEIERWRIEWRAVGRARVAEAGGLRHLARRGLPRVTLYVDGDNTAALATYERLGFERSAIDVMYGS